jgi:DNA-binding CsgD family transcriptional regulator
MAGHSGNSAVPAGLRTWLQARRGVAERGEAAQCSCVRKDVSTLVVRLARSTRYVAVIILEELNAEVTLPVRVAEAFTQREKEVMKRVCEGKRDREIGTILGLSRRTVSKHLEHVFQMLGVETRTAAARVAVERGINDRTPGSAAMRQVSAA